MVDRIKRVPLRDVWKHEAYDLTTWLEDNVDVLNDVLDIELCNAERERAVGTFSVDLTAEDSAGRLVVIENQLTKSDHDHLGKLLTYLTCLEARIAIWICSDPRPEHITAVTWLNESSAASFYLLKIEAIRIGESQPAPLLTLIVGPSEEGRQVGRTKKEVSQRAGLQEKFANDLLERMGLKTKLFDGVSPKTGGWVYTPAFKTGLRYSCRATKEDATVELYIDRGKGKDEENKGILDQLAAEKEAVEEGFGEPLEWQRPNDRRACRIQKMIDIGGYQSDEEHWPEIHEAMVDAMIRLEAALQPHLAKLPG